MGLFDFLRPGALTRPASSSSSSSSSAAARVARYTLPLKRQAPATPPNPLSPIYAAHTRAPRLLTPDGWGWLRAAASIQHPSSSPPVQTLGGVSVVPPNTFQASMLAQARRVPVKRGYVKP